LALVSGTAGAFAIGVWSDRVGPVRPLRTLLLASVVSFMLTAALIAAGLLGSAAPLILALTNAMPGLLIVALMPALLQASRGRAGAATQFEVYMATMNLGSVTGTALSGWLAAVMPLAGLSTVVATVFLGALLLVGRGDLLASRQ
jgi:PAT family beta-lactamase induction signal transducer AmpG